MMTEHQRDVGWVDGGWEVAAPAGMASSRLAQPKAAVPSQVGNISGHGEQQGSPMSKQTHVFHVVPQGGVPQR